MKDEEKIIGTVKSEKKEVTDAFSELREITLQFMEEQGISFEEFLERGKIRSKDAAYESFKKILKVMKKEERRQFIENLRKRENVNLELWEDLRDYERILK